MNVVVSQMMTAVLIKADIFMPTKSEENIQFIHILKFEKMHWNLEMQMSTVRHNDGQYCQLVGFFVVFFLKKCIRKTVLLQRSWPALTWVGTAVATASTTFPLSHPAEKTLAVVITEGSVLINLHLWAVLELYKIILCILRVKLQLLTTIFEILGLKKNIQLSVLSCQLIYFCCTIYIYDDGKEAALKVWGFF